LRAMFASQFKITASSSSPLAISIEGVPNSALRTVGKESLPMPPGRAM
jgi:hypothetical protein